MSMRLGNQLKTFEKVQFRPVYAGRDPDFLYVAPNSIAGAAFSEESRMKLAPPTSLTGNLGKHWHPSRGRGISRLDGPVATVFTPLQVLSR